MSGTHGDLFQEIGAMVLAAHEGQAIDLKAKAEELAARYDNLRVPADSIARAIARSMGAVGMSMALLRSGEEPIRAATARAAGAGTALTEPESAVPAAVKAPATLFPSGVRLAVLS
jgi:hypothetical protein